MTVSSGNGLCCGSTIPVKVKGAGGSGSLTGVVAVRGSLGDGNFCAIVTSGWGGLLGLRPKRRTRQQAGQRLRRPGSRGIPVKWPDEQTAYQHRVRRTVHVGVPEIRFWRGTGGVGDPQTAAHSGYSRARAPAPITFGDRWRPPAKLCGEFVPSGRPVAVSAGSAEGLRGRLRDGRPGASGWARRQCPVKTSPRFPGLYATVRRQIWQRVTGSRVTVTGKRREPDLLITSDDASPAAMTLPCAPRTATPHPCGLLVLPCG